MELWPFPHPKVNKKDPAWCENHFKERMKQMKKQLQEYRNQREQQLPNLMNRLNHCREILKRSRPVKRLRTERAAGDLHRVKIVGRDTRMNELNQLRKKAEALRRERA